MNQLFTLFAVFAIYPDITRIKGVNGNESPPRAFNFHHIVTLNEEKPDFGLFRKWDERDERLSIRGIRPIVVHALNEWKRAALIQGRIDFPNSQFYWGPHGLVKRSIEEEDEDESPNFFERDNEDTHIQSLPRYSEAHKGEYGEHAFEAIPTIILNVGEYPAPYGAYETTHVPCSYKTKHHSYNIFGIGNGNIQGWKYNPEYGQPKPEHSRSSEPRDPTLHSHGHSHFHQHVHSHGLNVLGPQTQLHGGTGFVHNAGLVTNVPISSTIPQTHITNINIPQQHSTGFTSHHNSGFTSGTNFNSGFTSGTNINSGFTSGTNINSGFTSGSNINGGFTSGLNHGLGGFSSHQAAVNIGHGGLGSFGTSTGGNVQIAQVSGGSNAVSQTSFREAEEESLGSPSLFQFPTNNRRFSFDRRNSQESSIQRRKRSIIPVELVSKILKTVTDEHNDRPKRSLPLVKLAIDPNAKLDVFQTSDNMGQLIKHSLDDEKSPVSHLKDMTGSLRDTFISSTRIIPSDVIVPARYKVIDTHQHDIVKIPLSRSSEDKDCDSNFVGGINPEVYRQPTVSQLKPGTAGKETKKVSALKNSNFKKSKLLVSNEPTTDKLSRSDPNSIYKTYQKIGDMIRNTVMSSQQTLSHVNDAISSGRKLAHTSKGTVPRLLLPLSKVPALEEPGSKHYVPVQSDRVLLVAPRGSGVDEIVGSSRGHTEDFVSTSNLFDSVGLTRPTGDEGNTMQRSQSHLQKKHLLLANNKGRYVDGALEVLNEAEETVDASNLHDFIVKLKNELERPHVVGEKNVIGVESSSKSCVCTKRKGKGRKNEEQTMEELLEEDPIVESSFVTNKDLLKPFMGRITLEDLHKILNDSRHRHEESKMGSSKREVNDRFKRKIKEYDDEPVLGAINPNLFEEYFDEPLNDIKEHHRDPFKEPADRTSQPNRQSSTDTKVDTKYNKFLIKPFVTNTKPNEETKKILEKFGYDDKKFVTTDGRKKTLPKIYEIVSVSS